MGKLLQVRVSAFTVDPSRLEGAWPALYALAYPPANDYAPARKGVLELVETLRARLVAGEAPPAVADRLKPGLDKAESLVRALEDALAAWQPGKAQALTEQIEEALDALEVQADRT
uniref:Formin-like protein 18 n=1 Tax=Fundidesulfovibrio putealis TaxID=270496 RepID=A0A7C4AHI9_9BACT